MSSTLINIADVNDDQQSLDHAVATDLTSFEHKNDEKQVSTHNDYVVMVTGSRDWERVDIVQKALEDINNNLPPHFVPVLVHGHCATGADMIAHNWAVQKATWKIRTYPAQWKTDAGYVDYSAGPKRNLLMITQENPHVVLGFRKNDSKGTTHAINAALKHTKKSGSHIQYITVYEEAIVFNKKTIVTNHLFKKL